MKVWKRKIFYLLDTDQEELLKEPAEMIRGWLCEILIARGDLASARLESLKDRGEITYVIPILTAILNNGVIWIKEKYVYNEKVSWANEIFMRDSLIIFMYIYL